MHRRLAIFSLMILGWFLSVVSYGQEASRLQVKERNGRWRFLMGDQPIMEYQGREQAPPEGVDPLYRRGAFIHPVRSPSGLVVTDAFPPNHLHQNGIWFSWTKTEYDGRQPDFWNLGKGTGTVRFKEVSRTWEDGPRGGLQAKHRFVDLSGSSPVTVLEETWKVTSVAPVEESRPFHVFDLVSEQENVTDKPLVLPEYHYGGLAFRGNWAWNGTDQARVMIDNGDQDRVSANETRTRWCYMGGALEGKQTGLAILGHPDNFRAPQPVRVHPNEPYFCFAPMQLGEMSIEPGTRYVSRYRFVVFDGPPDKAELDKLWNDYAYPPKGEP